MEKFQFNLTGEGLCQITEAGVCLWRCVNVLNTRNGAASDDRRGVSKPPAEREDAGSCHCFPLAPHGSFDASNTVIPCPAKWQAIITGRIKCHRRLDSTFNTAGKQQGLAVTRNPAQLVPTFNFLIKDGQRKCETHRDQLSLTFSYYYVITHNPVQYMAWCQDPLQAEREKTCRLLLVTMQSPSHCKHKFVHIKIINNALENNKQTYFSYHIRRCPEVIFQCNYKWECIVVCIF